MSVSTIYQPVAYAGDSSSVTFVVPWMFLEANDLRVWTVDNSTQAQESITDYTASGIGAEVGGSITIPAAIPGKTLHISRYTDRTQENDYTPHGRFPAESVERAFDKLTLIVQELVAGGGSGFDIAFLRSLLQDSATVVWSTSPDGSKAIATGKVVAEIPSFSGTMDLLVDSEGDMWDDGLCFVVHFLTAPATRLKYLKSFFCANSGTPTGKFAIYGGATLASAGSVKLVEGSLMDYSGSHYKSVFDEIDISAYDVITVCMDPGVSGVAQPVQQSVNMLPTVTWSGPIAMAGMAVHEHNTAFPSTAPAMIDSDIRFFLARWMALGVQ